MITIQKATLEDAETLTKIKREAFECERKRWLSDETDIVDYNIQPPGYDSVEKNKYMIRMLEVYKVLFEQEIVGAITVTISGTSYGRIDRIYIHPDLQGRGIGSIALDLIQKEYTEVRIWNLETSARQINNHHFYEKKGFERTFQSEDEFCYEKKVGLCKDGKRVLRGKDLSGSSVEQCDMRGSEYYGVNMEQSAISNANLMNIHLNNCNVSVGRFQNINLTYSLFADLNLSNTELTHVSLNGVRFKDTDLGEGEKPISFDRCNLRGSHFKDCDLQGVEISGCNLSGMKINNIPVEELLKAYKTTIR
ncbi:GNAT family N-acetyltransferase [Rossellomorea aquimaris]|uniref:GNAT family N-acetyltransferase n=1 Tax=Rossellomorea aquimaris TaxID=189382 RepID=UPI001CD7D762|nr:GNAT family N-acetyltransferase [Rossellomorea aquimaris]MCA1053663.1 GNAT family N-acetyltransferase [Rossellomorea aquimaris]